MSFTELTYVITAVCGVVFVATYFVQQQKRGKKTSPDTAPAANPNPNVTLLIAQAYERMVTFVSRSGFPSLLERMQATEMSAQQLADVYISTLQAEFEHNLSQQIYLPEQIWQAIIDMKEQQIFILRQIKQSLPENAPANLLSMAIDSFLQADPNASMQPMILELVKTEARKNLNTLQNT